jgi:hypothetical protein
MTMVKHTLRRFSHEEKFMTKSSLSDKEPLNPALDASLTLDQLEQVVGGFMFGVGALGSSCSGVSNPKPSHQHHGYNHHHGHHNLK